MRTLRVTLIAAALLGTVGLLLTAGSRPDPRQAIRTELPALIPAGANFYAGFADLQGDLARLDRSHTWLEFTEGANHEAFVRSRLWLRFQDRLTQMESLVGAPLDGPGLSELAASTCGLAFYDVGTIEFVYVAYADREAALAAALAGMEGSFQDRRYADVTYRIVRDEDLDRELAWAVHEGYLVVTDRERLLHATLDRIGGSGPSLADDVGFARVLEQLPPDGDQLVYLNLSSLREDGYFRTYWMQKDRKLLQRYEAFGAAVAWSDEAVTEHRFLAAEVVGSDRGAVAPAPTDALAALPADALVAKAVAGADPAEVAATFLDGGRGTGQAVDDFRTPLHDLLASGDLTRDEFDALVGDTFAVAVLARQYDQTFTLLDRVVVTRPTDLAASEEALRRVRERLPAVVTGRLAGEDVGGAFPMTRTTVSGHEVYTCDLITRGVYAPSIAVADGWLIMANQRQGAEAVIDALGKGRSMADLPDARRLAEASGEGPLRQVLVLDLARSTEVYEAIVGAMETGDTFRSWDARVFWTERFPDLLDVLSTIEGVDSWSTHTPAGLEGETTYLLFQG